MVALQLTNRATNQCARGEGGLPSPTLSVYEMGTPDLGLPEAPPSWGDSVVSEEHLEFTLGPLVSDRCRQIGLGPAHSGCHD